MEIDLLERYMYLTDIQTEHGQRLNIDFTYPLHSNAQYQHRYIGGSIVSSTFCYVYSRCIRLDALDSYIYIYKGHFTIF